MVTCETCKGTGLMPEPGGNFYLDDPCPDCQGEGQVERDEMTITEIAEITHEANRLYCLTIGDSSGSKWAESPPDLKASVIAGIQFLIAHPYAGYCASHEAWLKRKLDEGWKYGAVKDVEKKEHPCCRPCDVLPIEHQVKDKLFVGIVRALLPPLL